MRMEMVFDVFPGMNKDWVFHVNYFDSNVNDMHESVATHFAQASKFDVSHF